MKIASFFLAATLSAGTLFSAVAPAGAVPLNHQEISNQGQVVKIRDFRGDRDRRDWDDRREWRDRRDWRARRYWRDRRYGRPAWEYERPRWYRHDRPYWLYRG